MLSLYDVKNIDVRDIETTQFDIGLFASGFDARASFLPKKIDPSNVDNKLILGFSEWRDSEHRKGNDLFYREKYAEPEVLSSSSDREIYCELNKIFKTLKDKDELRILLDYTSMSRLWYSGILNYVKLQNRKKIEVYINYCSGDYVGKIYDFGYSTINSLPGQEGVLTSNDRTTLVIPVGFYSDIVRAVIQEIEPNEIVGILGIPSLKKEYEERANKTKDDLGGEIKKWLSCPVHDLEAIFRTFSEIINNSIHHEIMFLPLGPKTFNMASILVSQRFEHITCLYLKTKSNDQNSVGATGDCVCNKITYCHIAE